MWSLKKTNRSFSSKQGLLNHIRNVYSGYDNESLQAYLDNNCLKSIPKCACGNDRTFISFVKGFKDTCSNLSCANKASSDRAKSKYISGYQEYVLSNLDFYKSNWHNKNVVDPYTNKSCKNITLSRYVFRYVKDKDIDDCPWVNISKCVYCGNEIRKSIFSLVPITDVCDGNSCKLFKAYKNDLATNIFLKYKQYVNMSSTDETYINRICHMITERESLSRLDTSKVMRRLFGRDYVIPINYRYCHELRMFLSPITMVKYLNKHNIDLDSFIRRNYYSECFKKCLNCGKEIQTSKFPRWKQRHELDYCSSSCYWLYISTKEGRDKYGFNTVEGRAKQSETMKNKIRDGTFTPTVTNSWCRSKSEITINGKLLKYRSSWEVVFGILNFNLRYESVRIPYIRADGTKHNYIVDFDDPINKILYEIKPDSLSDDDTVVRKRTAAIEWCNANNYTYSVIGDGWYRNCFCKLSNHALVRKYDIGLKYTNKVMKGIKWKLLELNH